LTALVVRSRSQRHALPTVAPLASKANPIGPAQQVLLWNSDGRSTHLPD